MKKLLRETFEKVYCINLDSRPDKWDTCEQEFKKYGISDVVERWSGTQLPTKTHRAGARGCLASHLNIIKQCISDKTSNVLILEDDFEFLHYGLDYYNKTRKRIETDPREILQLALKQLSDVQWDLFYLGYNIKLKQFCNKKILSENLFQATGMLTTASYALTIDM